MAAKFSKKIDFLNFAYLINFMLEMDAQRVPEHKNITFCFYVDFQGHSEVKGKKGQNQK